ncbi:MAG: patatin-like phospholipase family protein [Patescibacteria group bacterium]|nr:patatin-like phospholipase family protein [Patescibacteria group bacterium]
MPSRSKIGLALGSGGFRGFAHIGVIQVLQENNIPIDCISGTSIGALVGAYFSIHSDLDLLEKEIVLNNKEKLPTLFDLGFRGGLVSGRKFEIFLERVLGRKNFSDCRLPLKIVATDLVSGQACTLEQGRLATAVRASTSVPLVFEPVRSKGRLLVDGGLSNPVPVNLVQEMGADKIIAVNLYHHHEFVEKRFNLPTVALRATRIAVHNLSKHSLRGADVVINPDTSAFIQTNRYKKYFDPPVAQALIDIGRREAKRFLPDIKSLLS